ncbi:MAG: insulinase family protein [Tannerella sp.]|nr:insulinase family protein [Tannerella sp.]
MSAQGLKAFKLPNGLSVFVWEDLTAPDVYGMVTVKVGSKDDPEQYTGLAHYFEHMMFKGTDKIGALDWEKEKPIYEQIIAKYDEYAATADTAKRREISDEINRLTNEASRYNTTNDFWGLSQGMGGINVNAATGFDMTYYHYSFPPGEIYKWLQLNSERFINPVFRNFQPELETVYEEYNRTQDEIQEQRGRRANEFILGTVFPGHPYARSVIGLPEHLKNPRLSQLIKFYNDWYVAGNMALILAGNVKTEQVLPLIRETFGRLENRTTPERKQYPENPVKGRKEFSAKLSDYPQVLLAFPGITTASEDKIALDICTSILSNSSQTGLINKLVIDGDLLSGGANAESLLERGHVIVSAIPHYDVNQQRFESLKSTEKMLLNEIKKLKEGKFDEALLQSIKNNMIRDYDLLMENPKEITRYISNLFVAGKGMEYLLNYGEMVNAITSDQIKAIAQKYFGNDYYAIFLEEGKAKKGEMLVKPGYDPIQPVRGAETEYAKTFRTLPVQHATDPFAHMDEVTERPINELSKLFYSRNPENDIFTLVLKFGIGTEKMPKLDLAVALMSNAGIMGQLNAQEVKQAFSDLGATCEYGVDANYLYVVLRGFEVNLEASCNLLTRQILMPQLDDKQLNSMKGFYFQSRKIEKKDNEDLSQAMREYMLYKDKSSFIDRLSLDEVTELSVSNLTGEFQRATNYAADIHYVGSLPEEQAYDILSKNLPLRQGEQASTSPEVKDKESYAENTILFLPNSDAKQSNIWFYIEGDTYQKEKDPYINAFNQYFDGDFNGLVIQEIREYRSLSYSSHGYYATPPVENKKAFFTGFVGTQADKTLEAIAVYMDLLTNMPQYPDRLANIKNYLKEAATVEKPHFRNASQIYQIWKLKGYTKSPAETNMPAYDNLTFDDIVKFYNENIKGRPIVIGIVGDPKMIDEKALEKYGKVVRLSTAKVFSKN